MLVPEYDLNNPSSWTVLREPIVDPFFDKGLIKIAGLNPFGKPNLVKRWGCTYKDPQNAAGALKYFLTNASPTLRGFEYTLDGVTHFAATLSEVPTSVLIPIPKYTSSQLGERRWVIEQWRSPAFLRKSGRYQDIHDTGESEIRISCKNCGSHMLALTGREDETECVMCGSKRQSVVETREIKNERLLNDFPVEGCYDYFLRLETQAGLYRAADEGALQALHQLWINQHKSFKEQEVDEQKLNDLAAADKARRINNIWATQ